MDSWGETEFLKKLNDKLGSKISHHIYLFQRASQVCVFCFFLNGGGFFLPTLANGILLAVESVGLL